MTQNTTQEDLLGRFAELPGFKGKRKEISGEFQERFWRRRREEDPSLRRGVSMRRNVPRDRDEVEGVAGWGGISKSRSLAGVY